VKREKRILVVDDNVELAENVCEILQDAGFEVDVFHDPRQALEQLVPGRYAVALLDIRMPGMDGVELHRRMKDRDPALSAVAMTAYAHDDRIRTAVADGMVAVFPKPLDVPRLLSRLTSVSTGEAALVVEDDVELAQNLVEILVDRGFSARPAHSCAEARRLAGEIRFRVMLADVRLPDGDGIDLMAEICRHDESCTVVVFSGHDREEIDPGGRVARQGTPFLEKPIDIARLLSVLPRAEGA
jgi:DNA-binding NtrC family response regulator